MLYEEVSLFLCVALANEDNVFGEFDYYFLIDHEKIITATKLMRMCQMAARHGRMNGFTT